MNNLIFQKIPEIMGKIGSIGKDRKNQAQGYNFRGIDDMYNALNSHLAEAKVFFSPEVLTVEREERASKSGGIIMYTVLTVRFTAYAEDGSSFSTVTVGEAMDSGDKSCNKAMSTAYKYALMQVFCIPTEEEKDTEYQSHEVAPKKEYADVKWYNDTTKNLEAWRAMVQEGKLTPESIIAKIEAEGYKINKANKDLINSLQ